ncbi:MAG TPA: ATP synthase F1 subunit epsilon [Patescibacteria group bacterium]|jgi:F-type H+-transporting ATPase subunit epsilon|nr:ATP synthase F1 subunit epsilon [Patescibacteria group bacterium]
MKLELITLTGAKIQDDVYEVMVPTPTGTIALFPGHMPLVTLAVPGVISVRRKRSDGDDKLEHFASNGGVIEVGQNVRILVDEADHADDIQEADARKALEEAQALKAKAKDRIALDDAQAMVDRQTTRLKVAELRRHHRRQDKL